MYRTTFSVIDMLRMYRQGIRAILHEFCYFLDDLLNIICRRRKLSRVWTTKCNSEVSIAYGFRQFAAVLVGNMQITSSLVLNMSDTESWSTITLITNHALAMYMWASGCVITRLISGFLIKNFVPELDRGLERLLSTMVDACCISYCSLAYVINLYFIFNRSRISKFLMQQCANIRADKRFQRVYTARLLLLFINIGFLSEPFIFLYVLHGSLQRARYIDLEPTIRDLIKWLLPLSLAPICLALLVVYHLVPAMSAFLSRALANHITKLLEELMVSRGNKSMQTESNALAFARRDWPSSENECKSHRETSLSYLAAHTHVYRKTIKVLAEIVTVLRKFERLFPNIHLVYTCQSTIIMSTLICVCILRTRLDTAAEVKTPTQTESTKYFAYLIVIAIFAHLLVMSILFAQLDKLPAKLRELKQHLFEMNLDLRRYYIEPKQFHIRSDRSNSVEGPISEAWKLYDAIERLCVQAHLKFYGHANYSKRLLLNILGQQLSICMLYVQFIDVYYIIGIRNK